MTLDELLCVQTGWHWCRKCQGLFFAGTNPLFASTGRCPQGDFHDDSGSGEYNLVNWLPRQDSAGLGSYRTQCAPSCGRHCCANGILCPFHEWTDGSSRAHDPERSHGVAK